MMILIFTSITYQLHKLNFNLINLLNKTKQTEKNLTFVRRLASDTQVRC